MNCGIKSIVKCLVGNIFIICYTHWICGISTQGIAAIRSRIFTKKDLNNLDVISSKVLSRENINQYFHYINNKIQLYVSELRDEQLMEYPLDSEYCRFNLILAQFRHLHSHMGMIMGFIIDDTGLWPRVLGLEAPFPIGEYH